MKPPVRAVSTLLLILLLVVIHPAGAEEDDSGEAPEKDPIEVTMDAAMEADPSTAGMVEAISNASAAWDRRMNSVYQKLKDAMEEEEWEALVAAQREWLKFRDLQTESLQATYGLMEGTMWIPASAFAQMDLTKQRAEFLQRLLETIEQR